MNKSFIFVSIFILSFVSSFAIVKAAYVCYPTAVLDYMVCDPNPDFTGSCGAKLFSGRGTVYCNTSDPLCRSTTGSDCSSNDTCVNVGGTCQCSNSPAQCWVNVANTPVPTSPPVSTPVPTSPPVSTVPPATPVPINGSCGSPCEAYNGDSGACNAAGCAFYFCTNQCLRSGTSGVCPGTGAFVCAPEPTSTVTSFSNLSATMYLPGNATFYFTPSQPRAPFEIDVSTVPDMSTDVYGTFVSTNSSPGVETNPTKWDKYSCGRTLYWIVRAADGSRSSIQTSTVICITPTAVPPTPTPTVIPTPVPTAIAGSVPISGTVKIFSTNTSVPNIGYVTGTVQCGAVGYPFTTYYVNMSGAWNLNYVPGCVFTLMYYPTGSYEVDDIHPPISTACPPFVSGSNFLYWGDTIGSNKLPAGGCSGIVFYVRPVVTQTAWWQAGNAGVLSVGGISSNVPAGKNLVNGAVGVVATKNSILTASGGLSTNDWKLQGTNSIADTFLSKFNFDTVRSRVRTYTKAGKSSNQVSGTLGNCFWANVGVLNESGSQGSCAVVPTATPAPDPGLVAWWKMDETSGSTVADSAGTNTGTATGTTIVAGISGNARSFNGSSDYVSVSDNSVLDITGSITIEAWIKTTASSQQTIVQKGSSNGAGAVYNFTTNSSGQLYFWVANGASTTTSTATVNNGAWRHVAVTFNPATDAIVLYVDGVANTTTTNTGVPYGSSSCPMYIGARRDDSPGPDCGTTSLLQYFNGSIDGVYIYNRVLSGAEILAQYQNPVLGTSTYRTPSTELRIPNVGTYLLNFIKWFLRV